MSVFKNIRSLFVVEDETTGKTTRTTTTNKNTVPNRKNPPKTTRNNVPPRTTTVSKPPVGKVGQAEKKFTDILLTAMEANNLEGLDYIEFKQSLQALSKMPMDEETRFKSAFAMAASMGATSDHLIKTAQFYINILVKEEKKFEGALKQQVDSKIGQQKREIASMEKSVAEKAEQIKRLTNEIGQIQQKVAKTKGAILEATNKINTTKSNFIASYNLLRGQIESDINNMKKYLGITGK